MARHGAPLDLVAAAARVPSDEIRHADYTLRTAMPCAGEAITLEIPRKLTDHPWRGELGLQELDLLMTEVSAIGETLACALLGACAERAQDPVARAVYGNLLSDEVHHARLGWYYLTWRAPKWGRDERQRVADRAGILVMRAEQRFWKGRDAPRAARSAARELGVLESAGQRGVVRHILEHEIVPALDALGLGASHAWRARRPMKH
jgi:hypothetical protein